LEQGAWSNEHGTGERLEPERDLGKHLTFFSLVYFVYLFVCGATLQRNSTTYAALCSAAPQATLALVKLRAMQHNEEGNVALQRLFCCATAQQSERSRRQRCCRRLLLLLFCAVQEVTIKKATAA
jgi:hypothetical protein